MTEPYYLDDWSGIDWGMLSRFCATPETSARDVILTIRRSPLGVGARTPAASESRGPIRTGRRRLDRG